MNSGTGGFDSHALPPFHSSSKARPDGPRASLDLIVRPYEPGDEAAILRAHNQVFAHVDPTQPAKSLALWRWQFARNPAGSRIVIALDDEGRVQGQYAGLRQRVHSEVGAVHFTQSVDSMHTRSTSPGLARASAFVRAGEEYARRFCGAEPELDQVMFGLAIPSAWRVGSRRLGYEHLRTISVLAAPVLAAAEEIGGNWSVESADRCPDDVAELFSTLVPDRSLIGVRDAETMNWRFAEHPEHRYLFGVVRERGRLRALGVFRRGSFAGLEGGLVCDWLAPAADEDAQRALAAWFGARTRESGAAQWIALFPDTAPEWLAFQRRGFRLFPTEYILATRSFRAPFDRDYLFWRWFYTLGDTDLV